MALRPLTFLSGIFLFVTACGSASPDQDFEGAYESAEDELSTADFEDVGDTSDCTDDCSGHEAGFEWAKEKGITDSSECSGDSQSFVEGCEAYAAALEEMAQEELEDAS